MNHIKEINKELFLLKFSWMHEAAFDICGFNSFCLRGNDSLVDEYLVIICINMSSVKTNFEEKHYKISIINEIMNRIKNKIVRVYWAIEGKKIDKSEMIYLRWGTDKNLLQKRLLLKMK